LVPSAVVSDPYTPETNAGDILRQGRLHRTPTAHTVAPEKYAMLSAAIFQAMPDVVLGALIGAIAGIAGSWLTSLAQRRGLREQLDHDAQERSLEREMRLRREVYLKAVEAAYTSIRAIGQLGDLNSSNHDFDASISEAGRALSRMVLVANDQTVDAVSRFQTQLVESCLSLMLKRVPVTRIQNEIDALTHRMDALVGEEEQFINYPGVPHGTKPDRGASAGTRRDNRGRADQWQVLATKRNELVKARDIQWVARFRDCISHARRLHEVIVPVVCAIRREMRLPFDERAYERSVEAHGNAVVRAMESALYEMVRGASGSELD
jgi:hypothetical protein